MNSKFFLIDNLSTSSEQIIEISEEKEIIARQETKAKTDKEH